MLYYLVEEQAAKYEDIGERQKFNINRLNSEVEKIENLIDIRIDRVERNLTKVFNDLRKV